MVLYWEVLLGNLPVVILIYLLFHILVLSVVKMSTQFCDFQNKFRAFFIRIQSFFCFKTRNSMPLLLDKMFVVEIKTQDSMCLLTDYCLNFMSPLFNISSCQTFSLARRDSRPREDFLRIYCGSIWELATFWRWVDQTWTEREDSGELSPMFPSYTQGLFLLGKYRRSHCGDFVDKRTVSQNFCEHWQVEKYYRS